MFALYPRLFPAQVSPELVDELRRTLTTRWLNAWRPSDPFAVEPGAPGGLVDVRLDPVVVVDGEAVLLGHSGYDRDPAVRAGMGVARVMLLPEVAPSPPPIESFAPRRRMISWLDPRLLALTAYEKGVSTVFGKWADARRVGGLEDAPTIEIGPAGGPPRGELWIDYVADPGDGFDPTFAVALAVAQSELECDGTTLPRGDLLVLGGDEVYPTASRERYENQLIGPYALVSRCVPDDGGHPKLLAIPGNHDWYDGLRSFDQLFKPDTPIGNWTCCQSRSYWAAQLLTKEDEPSGWWLWGVDLQLDDVFDRHQRAYFEQVPLDTGDRVILCSPIPVWAHAGDVPTEFDALRDFVESVVVAKKARVVLHLSGDSHHYARYVRARTGVSYVTAGGGGAFTHPTHHLPRTIELPTPYDGDASTLTLADEDGPGVFPSKRRSRWSLIWRNLVPHFYAQNRNFAAVLGGVTAIAAYATVSGDPDAADHLPAASLRHVGHLHLANGLSLALMLVALFCWTAFARPARVPPPSVPAPSVSSTVGSNSGRSSSPPTTRGSSPSNCTTRSTARSSRCSAAAPCRDGSSTSRTGSRWPAWRRCSARRSAWQCCRCTWSSRTSSFTCTTTRPRAPSPARSTSTSSASGSTPSATPPRHGRSR